MPFPPILCYHKVDTRLELGFTRIGPRTFRRQVGALAREGWHAFSAADLLEHAAVPSTVYAFKAVVLSFDDGYEALAAHAFPALAEHGHRALVFVITDYVGKDNAWDVRYGGLRFRHLDWDALGRWQERGVIEVQSHGASHARLTWLSDDAVAEELSRSRETITQRLGRAPEAICYPFGAVDERVVRAARAAGYALGFAGPGAGTDGGGGGGYDALRLPRLPVYAWDPFAPPQVLRSGPMGALARWGARTTSRIAVGTALIQRASGRRYR